MPVVTTGPVTLALCFDMICAGKMTLSDDVNLEEFVMAKDELSGADIKAVCTEAGLLALRERRMRVTQVGAADRQADKGAYVRCSADAGHCYTVRSMVNNWLHDQWPQSGFCGCRPQQQGYCRVSSAKA